MARPAGFEPTTPWFVARYSIQLSYGLPSFNYIKYSTGYGGKAEEMAVKPTLGLGHRTMPPW